MGLGSASTVSLARARELAAQARAHLAEGRNPLTVRGVEKVIPTFGRMADEVVAALETGWRNPKHRDQWRMTLTTYCEPIRSVPVDAVTTEHVLGILQPLWSKVRRAGSGWDRSGRRRCGSLVVPVVVMGSGFSRGPDGTPPSLLSRARRRDTGCRRSKGL
jgi:hypothetical protein